MAFEHGIHWYTMSHHSEQDCAYLYGVGAEGGGASLNLLRAGPCTISHGSFNQESTRFNFSGLMDRTNQVEQKEREKCQRV